MREFQALMDAGDKEGAMAWIDAAYDVDLDADANHFAFANLMVNSSHPGPALFILKTLTEKHPHSAAAWQNLCRVYEELDMPDEAVKAITKAHELKPDSIDIIGGLGCAYAKAHMWEEALKWSRLKLEHGDDVQAQVNVGYSKLCTGDMSGWREYNRGIGFMKWRAHHDYGLPVWNGEPDARVLFHKEQGIGDQIAFLSCIHKAPKGSRIAVQDKLTQLYRDSLDIPVFPDDHTIETGDATHQAAMSRLPEYAKTIPGKPYLKANPAKKLQWQALLDSLPKTKNIGIAWNGGARNSAGFRNRCVELSAFGPLFDMDANIISLEYKPEKERREGLHCFPWGTQTDDYSDTAALVACLDAVVCVPTSVYHLAGALGVPAHVWTPPRPHFHEHIGWWDSVTFHARETTSMHDISRVLNEDFHRTGPAAATGLHSIAVEHHQEGITSGNDYPATVAATASG